MDIVDRLLADRPSFHKSGTVRWDALPEALRALQRIVRLGHQTLEIGCGASTVVFAAGGARHTTISPDPVEHERVQEYCDRIGVDLSEVKFVAGLSDEVLPGLCRERFLDAAFIDGAHSFPYPEVDWHFVTKALKVGGYLLLDDVPIPAVTPLYKHMTLEPNWRLEGLYDERTAGFTMLAAAAPEEWSGQPFNRHYPDYTFLPLARRAPLAVAAERDNLKRWAAARFPRLRDVWKRRSGS